jgi:SAM-dependent methyltransferase
VSPTPVSTWFKHAAGRAIEHAPGPLKRFSARAGGFLQVHAAPPEVAAVPASTGTPTPAFPDPPVPVPPGVDLKELRAMLESFTIDGSAEGELTPYVGEAFWRFLRTWDLVRNHRGLALELGANPYFTTVLLERYTELDVIMANYFGSQREGTMCQSLRFIEPAAGLVEQAQVSHLFNIEEDAFPFDDGTFDTVLFCEILEHLLMNPVAVLAEIRRVLKPGGFLVLTTPNVNRVENVLQMVGGRNVFDQYSGFGPYGRHNREYTLSELTALLEFAGFEVETSFSANSNPPPLAGGAVLDTVHQLVADRIDELGQYLFVRATASRPPGEGLPRFLFRSYPDAELTNYP